jgi:hypothetical protein
MIADHLINHPKETNFLLTMEKENIIIKTQKSVVFIKHEKKSFYRHHAPCNQYIPLMYGDFEWQMSEVYAS